MAALSLPHPHLVVMKVTQLGEFFIISILV